MMYQAGLLEGRNSSYKARNPRAIAIAVKITKNQIAANGNGLETCRAPSCGLYFTLCNTYKYQPREMFLSWWYWSFTSWLRKKNKDAVKAIKKEWKPLELLLQSSTAVTAVGKMKMKLVLEVLDLEWSKNAFIQNSNPRVKVWKIVGEKNREKKEVIPNTDQECQSFVAFRPSLCMLWYCGGMLGHAHARVW